MRWAWYVACMGEMHTEFVSENLKRGYHLRDKGLEGKIILKCILKKQCVRISMIRFFIVDLCL